jgi:hypothetical protein
MKTALDQFAIEIGLEQPDSERLRLAFGYACINRIEHLLEEPEVIECLQVLGGYLRGDVESPVFQQTQQKAIR